jgi:hypothetical protein
MTTTEISPGSGWNSQLDVHLTVSDIFGPEFLRIHLVDVDTIVDLLPRQPASQTRTELLTTTGYTAVLTA